MSKQWSEPGADPAIGEAELRVRCPDGQVLRLTLDATEPLASVAAIVAEGRSEQDGPFSLRVPFPRREYASQEALQTTLQAAKLVPRGTLLVVNEGDRGVVRQAQPRRRVGDGVQQLMAQMAQVTAIAVVTLPSVTAVTSN